MWRDTSIVKGCSTWRDWSIVKRQAQASPLHNRVGLPRKILIFADRDGVCTLASLEVSKAVSVWNTLLPAAASLTPSPSPISLGHLANFSPSHIQLRYLLYPEAFPDTLPSLSPPLDIHCNLYTPSFRAAVWVATGMALAIGPQARSAGLPDAHLPILSLFLHKENGRNNSRPIGLIGLFLNLAFE